MAIAAASDYKTYKGITATTWDAQLAVMIPAIQAAMERYCGRTFDSASFDEYLDGNETDVLLVRNPPITSITSIRLYATPTATASTVSSSLYTFRTDESGEIRYEPSHDARLGTDEDGFDYVQPAIGSQPCWPRGFRNVRVLYVGAYGGSGATMPVDLKRALYSLLDYEIATNRRDLTLSSERLGNYQYQRGGTEERDRLFKALCLPFKRFGDAT